MDQPVHVIARQLTNRHGTPLGPHGYVLCQAPEGCTDRVGKPVEVQEISKDTAPAHARCRKHGTWAYSQFKTEEVDSGE